MSRFDKIFLTMLSLFMILMMGTAVRSCVRQEGKDERNEARMERIATALERRVLGTVIERKP